MKIIKIGSDISNDVVINDELVSQIHCQIVKDDYGNYRLIDASSANGTFVNGIQRHGEIWLNQADVVRIGNTTLPWQSYFSQMTENQPAAPTQSKPDNFMVWAILGTVLCCLPFGIASIVSASKVDSRWYAGDYEGAERAAKDAKMWFWWSFGVGLAISMIYIIYIGVILGLAALD